MWYRVHISPRGMAALSTVDVIAILLKHGDVINFIERLLDEFIYVGYLNWAEHEICI